MSNENKDLLEKAQNSGVFLPPKPRRVSEEELKIRDLILQYFPVMSPAEAARTISKVLGKAVTTERLKGIRLRMEQEARDEFRSLDSYKVAVESRMEFQKMSREGWRIILEAETMEDPTERSELKLKGLEFIRKAREAEDRLYKLCGLYKEEILLGYKNIMDSPEWKKFQSAFIIYLKYVAKQDPQKFFDFLEQVSINPHYVDQFIGIESRRTYAMKMNAARAQALKEGEYIDSEDGETIDVPVEGEGNDSSS